MVENESYSEDDRPVEIHNVYRDRYEKIIREQQDIEDSLRDLYQQRKDHESDLELGIMTTDQTEKTKQAIENIDREIWEKKTAKYKMERESSQMITDNYNANWLLSHHHDDPIN